LSSFSEKFSFNNNWLVRESSFTQNFKESGLSNINNGGLNIYIFINYFGGVFCVFKSGSFRNKAPEFIKIEDGTVEFISFEVILSDTFFTEISRVPKIYSFTIIPFVH
jgi:hypothetical protein